MMTNKLGGGGGSTGPPTPNLCRVKRWDGVKDENF